VPARLGARGCRQPAVEVDVHGAGQLAGVELRLSGAAVEVPADVGQDDLVAVLRQPSGIDERRAHRLTVGA
jgi:hypothetical protein